ncbi:MAG: hypothetical protein EXR98_08620 [Gemmataceae bacterium]|nr:hypothetical protein [Gemmataceae bacterium]
MLRTTQRSAFSLMEMLLALALGMLLLLALYFTLDAHLFTSQAGRDVVAEATLARNILARIGNDITSQFGAVDPRGLPDLSAASAADEANAAADPTKSTTPAPTQEAVKFNIGVQGDAGSLMLSTYRVQKSRAIVVGVDNSTELISDLRRINYWVATNGSETLGLARAEFKQATSADIDMLPMELDDQGQYVIAAQVKSITFEFYDGSRGAGSEYWMGSWQGSELNGIDATTPPIGPPSAIRITLELKRLVKGMAVTENPTADGPKYQHVVALPTSNSFPPKLASTTP